MAYTDHELAALARLCNCAKSRGRHSTYCPTYTAQPRIREALNAAYGPLIERLGRAERERDEALADVRTPPGEPT